MFCLIVRNPKKPRKYIDFFIVKIRHNLGGEVKIYQKTRGIFNRYLG